jgi:hypothetical protein
VTLFAVCIKALNATINGQHQRSYTWIDPTANPTKGEDFPALEDHAEPNDPGHPDEIKETVGKLREAVRKLSAEEGVFPLGIETITPQMAKEDLTRNTRNRKIAAAHVDAIARELCAGNWMMNAQPICFARDGRLLNGQHRLSTVLQAVRRLRCRCARVAGGGLCHLRHPCQPGLHLGAVFDSLGDKLLVAAAAVLLWKRKLKPSGLCSAKPTPAEVMKIIEQHPCLLEMRTFRKMIKFGRGSVPAYAACCIVREDPELGKVLSECFETGADLPRGHLILELRKRMQIMRRERTSQEERLKRAS